MLCSVHYLQLGENMRELVSPDGNSLYVNQIFTPGLSDKSTFMIHYVAVRKILL